LKISVFSVIGDHKELIMKTGWFRKANQWFFCSR